LHQALIDIVVQHFRDGGSRIGGWIEDRRFKLRADDGSLRGACTRDHERQQASHEKHRCQQETARRDTRVQIHAVPNSSDLAAIAITFAEFTISSMSTYSSG
jgi:hypothetical protein